MAQIRIIVQAYLHKTMGPLAIDEPISENEQRLNHSVKNSKIVVLCSYSDGLFFVYVCVACP
jgi:hypothetical protein